MSLVVDAEKADEVAVRLGDALRKARGSMSAASLARGLQVAPNYIARWEAGGRRLDLETIERIEMLLGVRTGTVLRLAGYVDDGGLIDLDTLTPGARRGISAILREYADDGVASDGTD